MMNKWDTLTISARTCNLSSTFKKIPKVHLGLVVGAVTGHWTPHPSLGHLSNRPDSHSWEKARIWGTPPETRPSVLESGPFGDGILCNIV